ncbi:MAG: hypothetical protein NKF70_02135 [Methanobacterium sp. ERen5]|nr:MAG: hypothetical protein NKF70_02135 [Methanobacterium sp. ERen5]
MTIENTLLTNIKLIFSKKGYNLAFNYHIQTNRKDQLKGALLFAIYFTISLLIISFIAGDVMNINFLLIFFSFCTVPLSIVMNFDGKFTDKYEDDGYNAEVVGLNYYLVPLFVMAGIVAGIYFQNVVDGLAMILPLVFPLILMLHRMETFSDKSRYEYSEMKMPIGPGYVPIIYGTISIIIGICITSSTVRMIGHYPLGVVIISICIALGIQSLFLFPDKINKVLPFDLRTKNGLIFMIILGVILYVMVNI